MRALEVELTDHLGYEPHRKPPGGDGEHAQRQGGRDAMQPCGARLDGRQRRGRRRRVSRATTAAAATARRRRGGQRRTGLSCEREAAADASARREVGIGSRSAEHTAPPPSTSTPCHQFCNNAGIGFSRSALETEYADDERLSAVNLRGVIHGTKPFLPRLVASGDGHLIDAR